MKPSFTLLALIISTSCTPAKKEPSASSDRVSVDLASLLDAAPRTAGRYQILEIRKRIFKIDTMEGTTWELLSAKLDNPNVLPHELTVEGWNPITNSFSAEYSHWQFFKP